jgi:hypothetical protein
MAVKTTRDSEYYLNRMKTDWPKIHGEYIDGRITAKEAIYRAGYQARPTPLSILMREWKKATAVEKREFINWARSPSAATRRSAVTAAGTGAGLAARAASRGTHLGGISQHLTKASKTRLQAAMRARSITANGVMAEMGFDKFDSSLSSALRLGTRIKAEVAAALAVWLRHA